MWRTIQMWLMLRELKREVYWVYNKADSMLIRKGNRKFADRIIFTDKIAKGMTDRSLYQPNWLPFQYVIFGFGRKEKDYYFNLASSLVESAYLHTPKFIELMSQTTNKTEDNGHIRTTPHGDEFCSASDFAIYLLAKYKLLWVFIFTPVFSLLIRAMLK